MSFNKTVFYNFIRKAPFGNTISPNQVKGTEFLLDYYLEVFSDWDLRWVAYVFATVFHETAATMAPIKEYGSDAYLKSKKYYPYYGRGYVQLTWKTNYEKYGIDDEPDKALDPETAASILFQGMRDGVFTGKKLEDYFSDTKNDPVEARRIVNGTDKAKLIAGYHKNFLDALTAASEASLPVEDQTIKVSTEDVVPIPKPTPASQDPGVQIAGGAAAVISVITALQALANGVTNPYQFGVVAIAVAVAGFIYYWTKLKKKDEQV